MTMGKKHFHWAITAAAISALSIGLSTISTAQAAAPLGYQMMCLKTPSECRGGGATKATLTKNDLLVLKRVNAAVNRAIKPKYDAPGTDVWTVGATQGDCEEYALTKRRALIKEGFPPSSLRIAAVKTRRGEGHAVLIVRSNMGDLVLDNLTGTIKPLSQSGLRLVSMATANPLKWT